jgi:hypothetical protein
MNDFDFHYLYISSKTIKPLKDFGVERERIHGRVEYRRGQYPKKFYETSIHGTVSELEEKMSEARKHGLLAVMKYHCAD